ncbi:MAG: hypothetical protein UH080_07105 [Ruminococcus sp.]|nr:hypothetical protein [Ruminococcus sp.]
MMNTNKTNKSITRGFVTVATGNEYFYKLARTMLRSYRRFNSRYPFAIICDRKNEYTEEFDDIVILDKANNNYVDKLRVFTDSPYDESFFIEPDCIIYNNIDVFFELLAKDCDFSSFGWNDGDLNVWFSDPQKVIDKYGEKASSIRTFNPGYFFVRKSETCKKIYSDAMGISEWIKETLNQDEEIKLFNKGMLRDDPLLALAMTLNNCFCHEKPKIGKCISLPSVKKINDISIVRGKLDLIQDRHYDDCKLLHFSTHKTKEEGLYLQQSMIVDMLYKKYPLWLVKLMEKRFVCSVFHFFRKAKYGIKSRICKK